MQPITMKTRVTVDEKRRIMIDLPDDVEPGTVELDVVIRPVGENDIESPISQREMFRAKLIAAGHLSNTRHSPTAKGLSQEERERLWKQAAGGKTALELVDEEREERF
jgi:hypothetical protein